MQAIDAVRSTEEVGRAFAGAADAAEFGDADRIEREVVRHADDLAGDRVMAAAVAQRRGRAFVIGFG